MSDPFAALGAIGGFVASAAGAAISGDSGTAADMPAAVPDETELPPDPTEAISDFVNALMDCIDLKIIQEGIEFQRQKDFERRANETGL